MYAETGHGLLPVVFSLLDPFVDPLLRRPPRWLALNNIVLVRLHAIGLLPGQ